MRQTPLMSFFEPPPPPERPEPPFEIPEPEPWWSAPSNELGAPVPLRVVLARTDQVAVAVVGVTAYTTGVSLTLALRRRSSRREEDFYPRMDLFDPLALRRRPSDELPPELLRFGVQFADGRRATTLGGGTPWAVGRGAAVEEEPSGPILSSSGGGGNDREWTADYWLWPLPPPGTLTFAIEWPSEEILLSTHEVDASLIIEASKSSEVLWPDAGESADAYHSTQVLRAVSDEEYPEGQEPA